VGELNDVLFLLEIDRIEAVNAFTEESNAAAGRPTAGVIDGEHHFRESDDR
jgi:hypothetical protein